MEDLIFLSYIFLSDENWIRGASFVFVAREISDTSVSNITMLPLFKLVHFTVIRPLHLRLARSSVR